MLPTPLSKPNIMKLTESQFINISDLNKYFKEETVLNISTMMGENDSYLNTFILYSL